MAKRRHKRRHRGQDLPRGGRKRRRAEIKTDQARRASTEYYPMQVFENSARRGIQKRLLGAVLANGLVVAGVVMLFVFQLESFALLMGLVIAASLILVSIGLLLSANAEESVHQLAAKLHREDAPQLATEQGAAPSHHATDGSI